MSTLIVVENPERWPLSIPGIELVAARAYLLEPRYSGLRRAKVFNLCRRLGYQSTGYYVSLLAAARGHLPLPSVATIQDLRLAPVVRVISEDLADLADRSLRALKTDEFQLSIYFGRNLAKRYDRLSRGLFNQFPAPLLRATFVRNGRWRLRTIRAIAAGEIPESHLDFVAEAARGYFARPRAPAAARPARFDLAILVDPAARDAPSDERALKRFVRAGRRAGIDVRLVGREDYGRLSSFDALFIRETTAVSHHTYRFARRASAEGLVVIDDPQSIVRCSNKVYQAELFGQHGIPTPRTRVVHAGNLAEAVEDIGYPCVLKRPDAAFSTGVARVDDEAALREAFAELAGETELAIVQEFSPSDFDWRVGILGGRVLFVCRYYMARGHWQIARARRDGRREYGRVVPVDPADAPRRVLSVARRSARLIGDGLYGVDVKHVRGRALVMEVNDNPNIDAGAEDAVAKDALYDAIMRYFLERLEARGG